MLSNTFFTLGRFDCFTYCSPQMFQNADFCTMKRGRIEREMEVNAS